MKDAKLEKKKTEIEEMHFELKQKFESNPLKASDLSELDSILQEFVKLTNNVRLAEEDIKQKRNDMI